MITKIGNQYVEQTTGEVLNSSDWIINEWNGKITKVKRISDKQLAFIEGLEFQLGYVPKSHRNMPAHKASGYINKLLDRIEKKKQKEQQNPLL